MKKSIILSIVFLIFISCAGTNSGSTEERSSKDVPSWFLERPTSDTSLYGVGQAKKQNPSLAKNVATARARTEISQSVNVKVSSMLKDFMQESGYGNNAQALEFSEAVTKQVSNNSLQGALIKEAYTSKDGTIFILVEYSLDLVKKEASNAAKREEALYNEFKANQSFDELEKSISNMK
jgi:hypothetical protein